MAAPSVSRTFRRWCWHGHVCPPQECRDIPAVLRIDGDADAGLDHETMSFQYKGLFQGHEQSVRDPRGAHGGDRGQEQAKIITAEPRPHETMKMPKATKAQRKGICCLALRASCMSLAEMAT
jgi:hypothetical protein